MCVWKCILMLWYLHGCSCMYLRMSSCLCLFWHQLIWDAWKEAKRRMKDRCPETGTVWCLKLAGIKTELTPPKTFNRHWIWLLINCNHKFYVNHISAMNKNAFCDFLHLHDIFFLPCQSTGVTWPSKGPSQKTSSTALLEQFTGKAVSLRIYWRQWAEFRREDRETSGCSKNNDDDT